MSSLQPTECKEDYSNSDKEQELGTLNNMIDSIIQMINSPEQKTALMDLGMNETQIQEKINQSVNELNSYKQSLQDKINQKFTEFQMLQEKESRLMQINNEIGEITQKISAIPGSLSSGM
ncbi:MAG: hypothetical protein ACK518_01420 [bacterium]